MGQSKIVSDNVDRSAQDFSSFFGGHAAEIAHFDELDFERIV